MKNFCKKIFEKNFDENFFHDFLVMQEKQLDFKDNVKFKILMAQPG